MTDVEIDELEDFFQEIPTIQCGEGGCEACDIAFHRACDPIVGTNFDAFEAPMQGDGTVHVAEEWEGDTELDIRPLFLEDDDPYAVLGGEG